MQLGGNLCHLRWGILVYIQHSGCQQGVRQSGVLVPALPLTCSVIFKASHFCAPCPGLRTGGHVP